MEGKNGVRIIQLYFLSTLNTYLMYITNWEEFQKATEELYIASPELVIRRQNRKKRKPDDINIMF